MGVDVLDTDQAGTRVVRGGMLRTVSYAAGILVGLIATPLLTRHLGPLAFGRYNTVTSLMFIVTGLSEGGLLAIGIRELSVRDHGERREFMRIYLGMRTVLVVVGFALAVIFAVAAGYPHVILVGALISGAGLLLTNAYDVVTVPLQVQLRLGWTAALEFLRQVITTVLIVVLVAVGAGIYPFFTLTAIASGAAAVVGYTRTRRDVPLRPRFDMAQWWPLIRDAIPYTVATAVAIVYYRVAVVLMTLLSTTLQTGYFSLAFRTVEIATGLPWLIVSSAFPVLTRAARDDPQRLRYALQRLFEACAALGAGVALLIAIGAPTAVALIGGHAFKAAVEPLRVLGVAMIGTFFIALWGQALLSLREHAALLAANASALVVALALTLALAPSHGALGGAISTTGTELWLAGVYLAVLVRRHPHLRPDPRVLLRIAVAVVAAGVPAFFLPALPAALAAAVIYTALLVALRAIPAEVFEALNLRRP